MKRGPVITGSDQFRSFLRGLPANLEDKVFRGALKAGAEVLAAAAREECRSAMVRETISVSQPRLENGHIVVRVETKGDGAYLAPWLEFGTSPHLISAGDGSRAVRGRAARRANYRGETYHLDINGQPISGSVKHPGARPYPFMRPALDKNESAVAAAIGSYISANLKPELLEGANSAKQPDEG